VNGECGTGNVIAGLNFKLLPELLFKKQHLFLNFIESRADIDRRLLSEGRTTQSPAISARCQDLPSCHDFTLHTIFFTNSRCSDNLAAVNLPGTRSYQITRATDHFQSYCLHVVVECRSKKAKTKTLCRLRELNVQT
jgi:hypothetical protein